MFGFVGEMPPVTHFAEVDSLRDASASGSSLNEPEFGDSFGTSTPATFSGRWALRGIVETHGLAFVFTSGSIHSNSPDDSL
jgi:hypothetical protein